MIRLTKGPEPVILKRNAAAWTRELQTAIAIGQNLNDVRSRQYGHKDIKDALIEETHAKCAYCESKPLHVDFGDVEHIIPKSVERQRTYEWANLTLVCGRCNTYKSDKEGLFDPYAEDPGAYFEFHGPYIANIPGSEIAYLTRTILKLNRTELIERRVEKLDALGRQIEAVLGAKDPNARKLLAQALIADARSAATEYSAFLNAFVQSAKSNGHLPGDLA